MAPEFMASPSTGAAEPSTSAPPGALTGAGAGTTDVPFFAGEVAAGANAQARWRRHLNNPSVTWPYLGGRIGGGLAIAMDVALGDQGLDSGP